MHNVQLTGYLPARSKIDRFFLFFGRLGEAKATSVRPKATVRGVLDYFVGGFTWELGGRITSGGH